MSRRWIATAAALAVPVVAACGEQSRVDPDAAVTITGVATAPDGQPLADRPVRLGSGVAVADGALAVLTLGLACTTGACTGDVHDAATADDGSYAFELTGADTQSSFGEAVSHLVSVSGAPEGSDVSAPTTSARFRVQAERIELPPLRLVDPDLTVEGGSDVRARWSATVGGPYELTFETATPVPVWRTTTADTAAAVDPRLLEDTAGRVVVSGGMQDAVTGSEVEIRWRSPGVGYAGGAGAPPSRGARCGSPSGPCPLTDGDLTTTASMPGTSTVVTLAEPVPAELVVVRGCDVSCTVETSSDGAAFGAPVPVMPDLAVVTLDGAAVAAVRVTWTSAAAPLREVSVWGPRPPERAALAPDAEVPAFAAPGVDGNDPPWPLAAAAATLAAAVLAGAGYVLGRRPGR